MSSGGQRHSGDCHHNNVKGRCSLCKLEWRIEELEAAIRKHRDCRGDDRCFQDDAELYAVLPEGDTRPARDTAVTLENCARYITLRQQADPARQYVSPERRIEELERENASLRAEVESWRNR